MVNRGKGFTLIELMITLVIIAMVALVAVPFTTTWIPESAINDARAQLHRAHSEAKALALRNPIGLGTGFPAAGLKRAGNVLLVCQGDPAGAGCADGGGDVVWEGAWPEHVRMNGDATIQIPFNNRGQILAVDGNPVPSGLSYSLTFERNGNVIATYDDPQYNQLR
jgi:prepilin-type N-terminal cleavage/methylation domain-containing protein